MKVVCLPIRCISNAICVLFFALSAMSILPASAASSKVATETVAVQPFALTGFRSAQFAMNKSEVEAAVIKDFGLKKADIAESKNDVERTQALTIKVPDLLPEGGVAQLSYIFGYQSKTLIQVGVTWNQQIDPTLTAQGLVANGDVLRNHFLALEYNPEKVSSGTILKNGILLFRGNDAKDRTTILLLQGSFSDDESGQKVLAPSNLTILYSLNAEKPDIFNVKQGDF